MFSGGVALNCVANGKIQKKNIWQYLAQPAAGDAGGSLGGALAWHIDLKKKEII